MRAAATDRPKRLACVLCGALAAAGEAASGPRPSVVLVTLDTTRADRMGFLGSKRGLTPHLDGLARESVVFERAYAQAPLTTVSHATLLTGTYPPFHGVDDFGVSLPADVPYLPQLLREEGYRTAAFVGSLMLDPFAGFASGFDRGFDSYDAGFHVRRGRETRYESVERRGAEVVDRATRWLASAPAPFFLWVHLFDAHDPYDASGARAGDAEARYDAEIRYVDAQVGRLVDALRAAKRLDDSVLVVAADHGESLGDKGESTHGLFLYDATIRVPLMLRLTAARSAGARVSSRANLADVAPTVLMALGLSAPAAMQGESLLPLVEAKPVDRPSYAETAYPQRGFGWSPLASYRIDRFLFIDAPRPELFDERTSGPPRDVAPSSAPLVQRLRADMERRRRSWQRAGGRRQDRDPELTEKLAALGYVSAGSDAPARGGVDPKDKVGVANVLHDAVVALDDGAYARAIPLLERVVASDPQVATAQMELGKALSRSRQYARSLAPLRKAISLRPDALTAHYEMGVALFETGDWKTAAAHFEIVASRMPKWADARFSLGSVYARINRVADALRELRAALDIEPKHYRANLLLGRVHHLQGRLVEAVPFLETASDSPGASAEAFTFLAEAYEKLGRAADAARARERAARISRTK